MELQNGAAPESNAELVYKDEDNEDPEDIKVITKVSGEGDFEDPATSPYSPPQPQQIKATGTENGGEATTVVLSGFTAPFDKNGVLYYLGTEGGTAPYQNPHLIVRKSLIY